MYAKGTRLRVGFMTCISQEFGSLSFTWNATMDPFMLRWERSHYESSEVSQAALSKQDNKSNKLNIKQ